MPSEINEWVNFAEKKRARPTFLPGTVLRTQRAAPCGPVAVLPWSRILSRAVFMVILLTIVHVIVCIFLAVVVLLQSGKAADLAGAFGGMGSQTVFGPRGSATVLSKATTAAAALFMLTSLSLSIISTRNGKGAPGIFDKTVNTGQQKAPAAAPANGKQTIPVPSASPAPSPAPAPASK